jgi:hypothetical protein
MKFPVGLARRTWLALAPFLFALSVPAQNNYEIQVYGAETVPAGRTMVELHSNYTIDGERQTIIDKQWGRWYFAVNPAFEKSLHGLNSCSGSDFAPSTSCSTYWQALL